MLHDLIIIGGGPAGTSAAISAARLGASVLLLERGRLPRHKVCGEFVSAESLSLLADLLDSQHSAWLRDAIRISRARVFVDGRMLQAKVDPAAASIARVDLDIALWHSAENAAWMPVSKSQSRASPELAPSRSRLPAGSLKRGPW